ncbi:hypothetical protein AMTR_s00009p00246900 [Amborella trichopoda]|uniref:Uncharacterized protein n=1 Tax=Amborella trichopoda TaxID=13333 RepID=W1NIK1_AMBTC|nr:hypothetical protein AMTR_s00009p00246900 [Amborella trichopoda]
MAAISESTAFMVSTFFRPNHLHLQIQSPPSSSDIFALAAFITAAACSSFTSFDVSLTLYKEQ